MTRPARTSVALGLCCALVGALAGCGVTRGDDSRDLLMIIPNSPGGGYDLTGRDAVQVLEDDDITGGDITVTNVVGAGGAVAMTEHEVRQTMGSDVADEILRVARDVDADAIVIGIRHRTPVGKLIMGSVAQPVIIDATCPVIAVKPARTDGGAPCR